MNSLVKNKQSALAIAGFLAYLQRSRLASCVFVATKPLRYSACPRSQAHKGTPGFAGRKGRWPFSSLKSQLNFIPMPKESSIRFRCSSEEKKNIQQKAESLGLTTSALLLKASLKPAFAKNPFKTDEMREVYRSLLPMNSNLNQIAHKLNTMREAYMNPEEKKRLTQNLQDTQAKLEELILLFRKAQNKS